ncbi:MAG: hypothetical protein ACRDTG_15870, partial [Pseudonocardiaceae bacterium]
GDHSSLDRYLISKPVPGAPWRDQRRHRARRALVAVQAAPSCRKDLVGVEDAPDSSTMLDPGRISGTVRYPNDPPLTG